MNPALQDHGNAGVRSRMRYTSDACSRDMCVLETAQYACVADAVRSRGIFNG